MLVIVIVIVMVTAGCSSSSPSTAPTTIPAPTTTATAPATTAPATTAPATTAPPSDTAFPAGNEPTDTAFSVYAQAGVGDFSPAVADAKQYVYVPSNDDGSVTVIDQQTMQVIDHFYAGKLVQHVVPDWDLRTLYATASDSNRLVPIDPATGKPGAPIAVAAPYNLYFTPDGRLAIVMAERRNRMDYYDRTTWKLVASVNTGACHGVNHADWSVDGSYFLATCEFSGQIIKVATATGEILNRLDLPKGSIPQDVRLAPDGSKFYVADMQHAGVWIIDADGTKVVGAILTGVGAHGIYPSRDGRLMYVTNRGRMKNQTARRSRPGEGTISVIDPTTDKVVTAWTIPGGGSPDMGGVSADGTKFWVSGRYDSVVYVFDTTTGALLASIKVPKGPHGLSVFPQPGRYSLGHTGNYR